MDPVTAGAVLLAVATGVSEQQGRDFTGLTFGATPAAQSRPGDPDAG